MSNICHRCGNGITANDYECPHCHCVALGGVEVPTPTPHAKTAEEVAKKIERLEACMRHLRGIQQRTTSGNVSHSMGVLSAQLSITEQFLRELKAAIAAAIRDADSAGWQRCLMHKHGLNLDGMNKITNTLASLVDGKPPEGHILDDAGNVRRGKWMYAQVDQQNTAIVFKPDDATGVKVNG